MCACARASGMVMFASIINTSVAYGHYVPKCEHLCICMLAGYVIMYVRRLLF